MSELQDNSDAAGTVSFIRDEPAEEDFFRTHTRLARAIATAIRSNPSLRVIGLLGRWGSGKSTVIKHLKEELEQPPSTFQIFTYDAWLHQSDPVRRSFLESFLGYAIDRKLTSSEKTWKEKLLELTGHVEKTERKQTPVLTNDAKWIFLSLLPVPIAVGLLDLDTIKDAWGKTTTTAGIVSFWVAVTLLLIPALVTYSRYRINKGKVASNGEDTPLLPILMNRSIELTKSTTYRSPDPTSIEFGDMFRDLMAEVAQHGRLLFVIDNLDRVAEAEALKIWATIRSFFLTASENEKASTQPVPIVVLPVDAHALERMFALSEREDVAKELARSFVNKTFDITFEVSEPVMSDWRDYLARQMKKVFANQLQTTWVFWTRYFFESNLSSSKTNVTPREINKLINRIAALFVQWQGEDIRFEVLAYYAVKGQDITDILKFINDPANDISRVVEDWKLQFAALHYGVAPNKAAQVLIEEPLRQAVANLDRRAFIELTGIPGFGDMFESITASTALNNAANVPSFEMVTNAALLLSAVNVSEAFWWRQAWRNLIDRYFDTEGLGTVDETLEARISAFYSHLEDEDDKQAFVEGTAHDIGEELSKVSSPTNAEALIAGARSLLDFSKSEGLVAPTFDVDLEATELIGLLAKIHSSKLIWQQIRTDVDVAALPAALAGMLRSTETFALVPEVVSVLKTDAALQMFGTPEEPSWAPLITTAADVVRQQVPPAAMPAAIRVLGELLIADAAAKPSIEALLNDGQIQNRLSNARADVDFQISLIALLVWSGRDFNPPSGLTWDQLIRSDQVLENLNARLRRFVGSGTMRFIWQAHAKAPNARTLLDALIRYQIETDDLGTIPLRDIVTDPDKYLYVVPWRLRARFISLLESYETFWTRLEETPLNNGLAEAAKFISQKGDEQAAKVRDLLKSRLEKVSEDDWLKSIRGGSHPLQIALDFFGDGKLGLGQKSGLYVALVNSITSLLTSSDRVLRRRWFQSLTLLSPKAERQIYDVVSGTILSGNDVSNLNSLLQIGGDKLWKNKRLSERPDDATKLIVLRQLRTKEGRAWLRDHADEFRSCVAKSKSETKQQLSAALRSYEAGSNEERRYWAEVVRKSWKLK